jgi:hypothetical protein
MYSPGRVLLVLLRAGQGVAVGGEYGGSAAFVPKTTTQALARDLPETALRVA